MGIDPVFDLALLVVAVFSGVTASIAGFGIGSLLTPLLASRLGMATAIAAVALPHALATAVRCWRLRRAIDLTLLRRFGLLSAAGSLAGALLSSQLNARLLTRILAALLVATAVFNLSRRVRAWRPRGPVIAMLGLVSGMFGGLAGNQGGLRAAALTAMSLPPATFVATATATGLMVDAARTPVYLAQAGATLATLAWPIFVAAVGVLAGTIAGERVLLSMRPETFRRSVAVLIGALGIFLFWTTT